MEVKKYTRIILFEELLSYTVKTSAECQMKEKNRVWIIFLVVIFIVCLCLQLLLPLYTIKDFNCEKEPFKQTMMNKNDHLLLLSMMERLNLLLRENKVEYFLIAGSLLGSFRYQNRMPWDDDIDIGIIDNPNFEKLPFSKFGLGILPVSFGYKVYDLKNSKLKKLESKFPFIDVFQFVQEKGEYVYKDKTARKRWSNEKFQPSELYPLTTCEYAKMILPCPAKSEQFLSKAYPKWEKLAYISGSHTGKVLFRPYKMPVNETTTRQVLQYLSLF